MTPPSGEFAGNSLHQLNLKLADIDWGIRFVPIGDRLEHEWYLDDGDGTHILLSSLPDLADSGRDRPVFQELVCEDHGHGPVLLAVGQSGKNHWSAAITRDLSSGSIDCEIACRFNQTSNANGVDYRIHPACHLRTGSEQTAGLQWKQLVLSLEVQPPWRLGYNKNTVEIAQENPLESVPATRVWRYSLRLQTA